MNSARRKILFVAQDAGGFAAVFPVYKKMKQTSPRNIWGMFGNVSKSNVKGRGIPFVDPEAIADEMLEKLFERKLDLLVVGTSIGPSLEKRVTVMARERSIPVIAIMDFWSNYTLRFSDPGTENRAYLPDAALVMDEVCKREMIKEGFDPRMLVVTGSPAFDAFKISKRKKGDCIVFLSQPFSELIPENPGLNFGYDEVRVFADVVSVLEDLNVSRPLIVKHHPRTKNQEVFSSLIEKSDFSIRVEKKMPTKTLIEKATLVIGMNTVALFEAALVGKNVISYQPGLNRPDPLISNRLGLSVPVYAKPALKRTIQRLLAGPMGSGRKKVVDRYINRQATQAVIHYLHSIALS